MVARDRLYEKEEAARAAIEILVRRTRPRRSAKLSALNHQIERSAAAGDHAKMREAAGEKMELLREERALDAAVRDGDLPRALSLLAT